MLSITEYLLCAQDLSKEWLSLTIILMPNLYKRKLRLGGMKLHELLL